MATHAEVAAFAAQQGLQPMQPSTYTPLINPDYVFRNDLVIEMVGFMKMQTFKAMWLTGLQGSGKTTLVEQFHAALGWPLITLPATAQTTAKDLIGGYRPGPNGTWEFRHGPATVACKNGCSILVDEYNLILPEETSGINKLIEGQAIDLEETGERIIPLPSTRFFVACNPADSSRGFMGRNEQDAANINRFWMVEVPYMEADVETGIISRVLERAIDPSMAKDFAAKMVEVANRVRKNSMAANMAEGALELTFSSRSLLMWAEGICAFAEHPNRFHFALERALTRQARPDSGTKEAIHQIVADVLGVAP